jgi:serine/threonine protein phosphatase PrpC
VSTDTTTWQVIANSVKAARKQVNQDWYGSAVFPDGAGMAVAVADGHGSAAHPRSDVGARLAVDAFLQMAAEFRAELRPDLSHKHVKVRAEEYFPRNLVWDWRERVTRHLTENPPGEAEHDLAATIVLYGTTLIGAMVTGSLVLGWQIGDGDLCLISPDGRATAPLRNPADNLGDDTDSLCSDDAQHLVRTYWAPSSAIDPPALIALSTDGLSNSFVSFDGYLEFISGMYQRIAHSDKVGADLRNWLEQASSYSGDDTTLVAAWRGRPVNPGPEGRPS